MLLSCNDDFVFNPINEQLPKVTTSGENTFGFLFNGQTWVPFTDDNIGKPISVVMGKDSIFMFSINLKSDKIDRDESLKIFLKCNKPEIIKPLSFTFVDNNLQVGCQVYDCNENGILFEVTYIDFIKQIISGTFQIPKTINSCGDNSIIITDGRFDCQFTK
jgi:hypothetical protein